jgi:DNA-binding NtrC family response regulator
MNETQLKESMGTEDETAPRIGASGGGSSQLAQPNPSPAPPSALRTLRAATEIHAISRALEDSGWNRKRAAKSLSISYRGLLYKIRQYNITPAARNNLAQISRPQV